MQIEIAVVGRQFDGLDALDQFLPRAPVFDQVGDGADFQAMFFGELQQLRQARHRAVVVHDFAEDADGPAAGERGQVHRRLGVAGALEHAARTRAQRKHVARLHQVVRHRLRFGQDFDGARPVRRADAGGDAARGVHAHVKIGAKALAVLLHHAVNAQLVEPFGGRRHANESAPESGHEIDGGGRHELRRP